MFRRHYRKLKFFYAISDVIVIALAFVAAYFTRVSLSLEHNFRLDARLGFSLITFAALCWVATGYWSNLYEKLDAAAPAVVLRKTFQQCALGGICVVVGEYIMRLDLSRVFVGAFVLYAWILLCLFRFNAEHVLGIFRKEFGKAHYVMVVGSGESARRLAEDLERSAGYGIHLLGFFTDDPAPIVLSKPYETFPFARMQDILRRRVVDEIIFAVDSRQLAEMEEMFLLCDEEGVRTRVLVDFFPHVNSHIYLDRFGSMPLLTFSAAPDDEIRLLLKRMIDLLLGAAALLLLAPIMLLIALMIRLTSPGPAIFRQERCGLNGRLFTFYKFRSMCDNAEDLKPALAHLNQKSTAFKIKDDPRLTGVGRILRKFSIDEWPQLWNVMRGDMSLVGPRPAVPEEVEHYELWQRRRLRMRPGLTCLWAIAGRDALDFQTWMRMDMQYIDSWSLSLDWQIMLRTIPRVMSGKGAH